ncbi:MAG: HAD family hydrolase [Myxococcota bacterium]
MSIRAVIFDLGGVVLGSPLHAIRDYEAELGIPEGFVNRVVVDTAPGGAWSRLERGEIAMTDFFEAFESECRERGQRLSARVMMERMGESAAPRPEMLEALRRLRGAGFALAALTNNWSTDDGRRSNAGADLRPHFDVFVESAVEGLRKPDPRIYRLVCERLGVAPEHTVFLDDIGGNLKPARALGMTTIRVVEPATALGELASVVGITLCD